MPGALPLREWVLTAPPKARQTYFSGNLAQAREEAAQSRLRNFRTLDPDVQFGLSEASDAWDLYGSGLVLLAQSRRLSGDGADYIAVRTRKT